MTIKSYKGTMFAGKTTALMNEALNFTGNVFVFKPEKDSRYSHNKLVTHDKKSIDATSIKSPSEIFNYI